MTRKDQIRRIIDGFVLRMTGVSLGQMKIARTNGPANDTDRALRVVTAIADRNSSLKSEKEEVSSLDEQPENVQDDVSHHKSSFLISGYESGRFQPLKLVAKIIDEIDRRRLVESLLAATNAAPDNFDRARYNYQGLTKEDILERLVRFYTIEIHFRAFRKQYAANKTDVPAALTL